jgi:hypothetical protein
MKKKKPVKSKTARMRDLPTKRLNAKAAKGVKGGLSISFAKVNVEYKPQRSD